MVTLHNKGIYLIDGQEIIDEDDLSLQKKIGSEKGLAFDKSHAKKGCIAYDILAAHNTSSDMENLKIKFDAMASHDITYVGIIQTARASGMDHFPLPYVLTCCHNSLAAVGGTINEDDHLFGLSAAIKYGGIYVPPHLAVIHQFMRECFAAPNKMILGSDSHTRYGALGCMAVGEGGGELDKQLLGDTWDIAYPQVVAIYLKGKPAPYVGPMDVSLAIIRAVYNNGFVKNKVMEFVGPGIKNLSSDYRCGIDVMTTETTCLSSIWQTDADTKKWLEIHGRPNEYTQLEPSSIAYYDSCVEVDLSTIKPMIAMPFHPSCAYEIDELYENLDDILHETEMRAEKISGGSGASGSNAGGAANGAGKGANQTSAQDKMPALNLHEKITQDGKLQVQQGIIAGCAGGTWSNIATAAHAMKGANTGCGEFYMSVYPSSQPVFCDLDRKGLLADLMDTGAIIRSAFCGPCFGAGDTPANNTLSIRHATRNFPNREGSKPQNGQIAAVALMDARSIAATAANQGKLTSAEYAKGFDKEVPFDYNFDDSSYKARVYQGAGAAQGSHELRYGPNIKDWPEQPALSEHILLKVCSKIEDDVTTTDELIPSGETSSYRSNPLGLAEFTLSRRDPEYVARAKEVAALQNSYTAAALSGASSGALSDVLPATTDDALPEQVKQVLEQLSSIEAFKNIDMSEIEIGSTIYANKPGDGSAREQAASCQRVLGGLANITREYATKRYRSNCINWGMLPFQYEGSLDNLKVGSWVFVPNIASALKNNSLESIEAFVINNNEAPQKIKLFITEMTAEERDIISAGCLINYNRAKRQ